MSRRSKSKTERKEPPAPERKSPPRLVIAILLAATLAGVWLAYHRFANPTLVFPNPPDHSDPIVAAQIKKAFEAVRKSPRSGDAWGKLGMILHVYLFNEGARICFANAQRLDSAEPRWPYFEGVILLAENPAAGLPNLARAVELCPSTPDTPRLQYARALLEQGHMQQAEGQFKELLSRNSGHAPALLGLARISHAREDYTAATEFLRRCLESPFAARSAYLLLASVQTKAGNAPAAQTAAEIARSLPPDRSWPEPYTDEILRLQSGSHQLVAQAERALKENRHDDAAVALASLQRNYSGAAQTWILAGRLKLERKDCAGAEQDLRRHLQLDPQSVNGHAQLGLALMCRERYSEAVPIFERAVQLKPDFAEGHFNLGFARARAGRGAEALPALRDAIRCSPNFIEPYIILADLLGQIGERAEALTLLQRAREINPNDPRLSILHERITAGRE